MSFEWEKRAIELGYEDSEHMLKDLILIKKMSFTEASKTIGCSSCKWKANRYGIRSTRGPGGANNTEYLLDQICERDQVVLLWKENDRKILPTAKRLGVAPETLRRWLIKEGLYVSKGSQ